MTEAEERICRAIDQRMSDASIHAQLCSAADGYGKPRVGWPANEILIVVGGHLRGVVIGGEVLAPIIYRRSDA